MKQFSINKNATLPYLEIEPIQDGRHDFKKLYYAIQAADVTFTMTNMDNGIKVIANAPCNVLECDSETCDERFKIQYKWKKRDTSKEGVYIGSFKIIFNNDVKVEDMVFPKGELIVPIAEELQIIVSDGSIKI